MKILSYAIFVVLLPQLCMGDVERSRQTGELMENGFQTRRLRQMHFRRKLAELDIQMDICFVNLELLKTGKRNCPIVKDLDDLRKKVSQGEIATSLLSKRLLEALGN